MASLSKIRSRVIAARNSPSQLINVVHLIGPVKGRKVTEHKLKQNFEDKLEMPTDYIESDALLGARFADFGNMVLIFGGNHRLSMSERVVGLDILPVKLIDLEGIQDYGETLTAQKHGKLLTLAIELTENRPTAFGIMEQVRTYADLKVIWSEGELRRQEAANTDRGKKPKRMTHQRLIEMYREEGVTLGVEGISFMSRSSGSDRTCSHYMAGADRLIESGEIDFLSLLEGEGIGKFTKSNLNRLRLWAANDIKKLVQEWKEEYYKGYLTKAAFSREEEAAYSRKKEKGTQETPRPIFIERSRWNQKKMNKQELRELYSEVQNKVQVELQDLASRKEQISKMQLEQRKLEEIVKNAEKSEKSRRKKDITFDLQKLMEEVKSGPVIMEAEGGGMSLAGLLLEEDLISIRNLSWATDNVFFFCANFVINWCNLENSPYIMDSLLLLRWFSNGPLREKSDALLNLKRMLAENKSNKKNRFGEIWNRNLVVLPIVAEKHWSIAFVANLPLLTIQLESKTFVKSTSGTSQRKPAIFWFDSMHESNHLRLQRNILHMLAAAYREDREITAQDIAQHVVIYRIIPEIQKKTECGFYSLYYLTLALKNLEVFESGEKKDVDTYIVQHSAYGRGLYTFQDFTRDLQSRVEKLRKNYIIMNKKSVPSPPYLWEDWEKERLKKRNELNISRPPSATIETSNASTETDEMKEHGFNPSRKRNYDEVCQQNSSIIIKLIKEITSASSDKKEKNEWFKIQDQVNDLRFKKQKHN